MAKCEMCNETKDSEMIFIKMNDLNVCQLCYEREKEIERGIDN